MNDTAAQPPMNFISIPEAARWLNENTPRWAMTASQLRTLCESRAVPYQRLKRASGKHKYSWNVCLPDILQALEDSIIPAIK